MTLEEAEKILTKVWPEEVDPVTYGEARGFIEGYEQAEKQIKPLKELNDSLDRVFDLIEQKAVSDKYPQDECSSFDPIDYIDWKQEQAEAKCVNDHASVSRIKEWFDNPKRKPANTAFTEGPERQVAYLIEMVEEKYRPIVEALEKVKVEAPQCGRCQNETAIREIVNGRGAHDPRCDCGGSGNQWGFNMEIIDEALAQSPKSGKEEPNTGKENK